MFEVPESDTDPFSRPTATPQECIQKALDIISRCTAEGENHKQYALDQVVRALTQCPIVVQESTDYIGGPFRYRAQGESEAYKNWVTNQKNGDSGPDTYDWDTGVSP
jgi:hypothetical protein